MVFSEYPYVGMDFRGDPDLVLPDGEQWGAIGKFFDHIIVYCFIHNVVVLYSIKTFNHTLGCMQMLVLFVQQFVRDRQLLPRQWSLLGELSSATLTILRPLQLCRSRLRA